MEIYRKGIYKNVTEQLYLQHFKRLGYEIVKKQLTPKQELQNIADSKGIKYIDKTTIKQLEQLIKDGEK